MDWLGKKNGFEDGDLKDIKFFPEKYDSSIQTISLFKDESGAVAYEETIHESEGKFDAWTHKTSAALDGHHRPCIILVLHSRLSGYDPTTQSPMEAMSLTFGKDTFLTTAERLFQHSSLSTLLKGSSNTLIKRRVVTWDTQASRGESIVYNCRSHYTPPNSVNDVAMSVTCFPKAQVTFGILYGCTKDTKRLARVYMKQIWTSKEDWHPHLLPVFFAEVERKRLLTIVGNHKNNLSHRVLAMEMKLRGRKKGSEKENTEGEEDAATKRDYEATKLWMEASRFKNGLLELKHQLQEMIDYSKVLSNTLFACAHGAGEVDKNFPARVVGSLLEARLMEMVVELDNNIRNYESMLGGMSLATQMEWNYYTRRDTRANIYIANATKRDSHQMRSISLLGMIFLPGTFFATLFSMGFFDWTSADRSQIISPWIAVYIIPTVILTAGAVWQWWKWTKEVEATVKRHIEEKLNVDQDFPPEYTA